MFNFDSIRNPIWKRSDNLRDPSVYPSNNGYYLFYSRFSNNDASRYENWAVACVFTRDFVHFENDRDITPKGFASPGEIICWNGSFILPLQSYPERPAMICYIESKNLEDWSKPVHILAEALDVSWNLERRAIDPTFVVDGDTVHCYYVGSDDLNDVGHTNLMGHAVTTDIKLDKWEVITIDKPMIGCSQNAPDGVENATVVKSNHEWLMIYSEGLKNQHLAYATSVNLYDWQLKGSLNISRQKWMNKKYGAPCVWKENGLFYMILMGEDDEGRTTFGILSSSDGINWKLAESMDAHD